MTRRTLRILFALLPLAALGRAAAADAPHRPNPGAVVELPPMIVADTAGSAVWLYASAGDDEFLSRCPPAATQGFLAARAQALLRLRALVPDGFLAVLPSVTVIDDHAHQPKADDTVARDLLRPTSPSAAAAPRSTPLAFLPNLRLDDRDLTALFAYVDADPLLQPKLTVTADHLRFLLEKRVPMLPPWLVESLLAVHADIEPGTGPVTLRPLVWLSDAESRALTRNPLRPRVLLPANELFAPDVLRGPDNGNPRRAQILQAQLGLFARWALDPRNAARAAFWTFARRAAEERVTEPLFAACFGFGFSDLRDRLNDYLPLATKDPLTLEAAAATATPTTALRPATPAEVARLRGEWERLEITHVQRLYLGFADSYIAQARRTLHRAYDQGDRDPRLLTALGLCEVDAGNPVAGLPFLEAASAAGATRPRVSYEIARLQFAELLRGQPANRVFTAEEIAPILLPLRRALTQSPELPEIYGLLADAWVRARTPPPPEDMAALVRGARSFALHPTVGYRLALALARYGRQAQAADLLDAGVDYLNDEALRRRYVQLRAALTAPPAPRP